MQWMGRVALAALLCVMPMVAAHGEDDAAENYVRAHYTKYEFRIPMRDGKRLFTVVYVPKDVSEPHPMLMMRTPYSSGPYGADAYPKHLGPAREFEEANYIFVEQDVRGRYMSEGDWTEMTPHIDNPGPKDVDESTDTHDTIDYLLKHVPNNNGRVGIYGTSYPGFYTSASIIDSHPAIKAASPQAPMTDIYMGADDSYHGGAFMLSANFEFYADFYPQKNPTLPKPSVDFDFGTPDSYRFYLNGGSLSEMEAKYLHGSNPLYLDQMHHWSYDEYWKKRNIAPHLHNIHAAVMVVGGWYDAEDLSGPLKVYHAVKKLNPDTPVTLVEGPWVHGGWGHGTGASLGDIPFGSDTAEYFRHNIEFPFFEYYLRDKGTKPATGAVTFETGKNEWHTESEWPPKAATAKTLYFHADGKLSFDAPTEAESKDEYVSDSAHPVPFVGYTTDTVPQRFMVDDQRFASARPDVVTYQTEPLEEDVTIAGPIVARLLVASSGTDSDFDVKLIDVLPSDYPNPDAGRSGEAARGVLSAPPVLMGGYEELLRGEPFRAKFRNSFEKPEPLVPSKMAEINFPMTDLYHTFRRGHRIMVQVQSSMFPLTDRNPQVFTDIPNAKSSDFVKATETIYHQAGAASGVEVLVLPAK